MGALPCAQINCISMQSVRLVFNCVRTLYSSNAHLRSRDYKISFWISILQKFAGGLCARCSKRNQKITPIPLSKHLRNALSLKLWQRSNAHAQYTNVISLSIGYGYHHNQSRYSCCHCHCHHKRAIVISRKKGDISHTQLGKLFFVSMVSVNITASAFLPKYGFTLFQPLALWHWVWALCGYY